MIIKSLLLSTVLCASAQAASSFAELALYAKPLGRALVRSFAGSLSGVHVLTHHKPLILERKVGLVSVSSRPRLFSSLTTHSKAERSFQKNDSFWREVHKIASGLSEDSPDSSDCPPLLKKTDTWETIAETTKLYCATTATTVDKELANPAFWTRKLAASIAATRDLTLLFQNRSFRDDLQSTSYIWESEIENVFTKMSNFSLKKNQAIALLNLKLVYERAFFDADGVEMLEIFN